MAPKILNLNQINMAISPSLAKTKAVRFIEQSINIK